VAGKRGKKAPYREKPKNDSTSCRARLHQKRRKVGMTTEKLTIALKRKGWQDATEKRYGEGAKSIITYGGKRDPRR